MKVEIDPVGKHYGTQKRGVRSACWPDWRRRNTEKEVQGETFDVLGGGFGGDHPVEKESFDSYSDVSFGGSSDALMETGGSSSSNAKPKKKGLFASIFGGGRKKKQKKSPAKSQPLEQETEKPESYVP
ncbi:MAG TPA: hypothetical protein O0X13_00790, partial [Methanocorpusculum sp.]|nr:hypothetical protein [Methanocorpusculum sp.]